MAAAEKSVAAIILRRHVVTTDCMGRLMRTGCSREPPSRPYFSLLRESALKTRRYGPFLLDLVLYLRVLRARGWWQPVPHPVKVPFLACGMRLSLDGGNRHDGDPVIARRSHWRGAVAKRLGWPNLLQDTKGPPKPMRILVSAGLRAIRECAPNVTRLRDHRMPCATMALATLTKPAALAPSIRSPSWPYSLAAARESATMVSMMFLSLASTSSKDHDRR